MKKVTSALVSVYHKEGLDSIIDSFKEQGTKVYSTGGTLAYLQKQGLEPIAVEDLTGYPSILGGRVKTLHPKVFGGILARRPEQGDLDTLQEYDIPQIDMVIVDLYPFRETVAAGGSEADIIEKIDIGGIALIRGAAKNFSDVLTISSRKQYSEVGRILKEQEGATSIEQRRRFAAEAFAESSAYDSAIKEYFLGYEQGEGLELNVGPRRDLRYGENPHQQGTFYGPLSEMFTQLNGKELSYNNLVDIEAAVALIEEFTTETAFAILKHTNPCGVATGNSVADAYGRAFAADTVSAFGGILVTNAEVDLAAAEAMHDLFFEVLIAPSFAPKALELLTKKKNRIVLQQHVPLPRQAHMKGLLNGVLVQEKDLKTDGKDDLTVVTKAEPTSQQVADLLFASKVCKHTKSNGIVLARDGQMLANGVGQTSRVDALNQAVDKAKRFDFDLKGAVMASDAFFPFPDCVEIAHNEGVAAVIQPGGSKNDQLSVDYCDQAGMAMVTTGFRHFKH